MAFVYSSAASSKFLAWYAAFPFVLNDAATFTRSFWTLVLNWPSQTNWKARTASGKAKICSADRES